MALALPHSTDLPCPSSTDSLFSFTYNETTRQFDLVIKSQSLQLRALTDSDAEDWLSLFEHLLPAPAAMDARISRLSQVP